MSHSAKEVISVIKREFGNYIEPDIVEIDGIILLNSQDREMAKVVIPNNIAGYEIVIRQMPLKEKKR